MMTEFVEENAQEGAVASLEKLNERTFRRLRPRQHADGSGKGAASLP